ATGQVRARFQSFDPATAMPLDVLTGFLPPEDGSGRGQGHFSYVIRPDAGLPTGTAIRNVARISFDYQEIITTNQVDPHDATRGTDAAKEALVTIDAGPPASAVLPLPTSTASTSFLLRWSGLDDAGGSGLASYTIQVATDGGPFVPWLVDTTATEASFLGVPGHSYAFFSVARDQVGHVKAAPSAADATISITISPNAPPVLTPVGEVWVDEGSLLILGVTATDADA